MKLEVRKKNFGITFTISLCFIMFFASKIPEIGFSKEEILCYIVVLAYSSLMLFILCYIVGRIDFYVFEPITILWMLFFCVYGLQPMIDILNRSTGLGGITAFNGGIKCTIIVAVSFVLLTVCYYNQKVKFSKNRSFEETSVVYKKFENRNQIAILNAIIWIVSTFFFFLYLYKVRGLSIKYILSAGTSGEFISSQVSSTPLGFLSNFACTMIAAFMYYLHYGKSKILKIIMGGGTLLLFVLNGYRFIIVTYALAIMVYYYIAHHKKPKIQTLIMVFILLVVMAAILATTRQGLRHGNGWDLTGFTMETVLSPFESNFILYRPLWRMVEVYPSKYGYTLGYQMFFYTAILLVPRAVWPGKPIPPTREVLMNLYNNKAIAGAQAFSSIGEFYQEFGILGCLLFMSITGYVCGSITKLYLKENINDNDLILYAMLFPIVFSLTNAGYTPNNFYMVLFAILPIIITGIFVSKQVVD